MATHRVVSILGCNMALTELLQPPEVDAVLSPVVLGRADEEVGFLQDEEGLLPPLRVEHALVAQLAHALEFVAQQAMTAHGREPLQDGARDKLGKDTAQPSSMDTLEDGGRSLGRMGVPRKGRRVLDTEDEEGGELGGITTEKEGWAPGTHQWHRVLGLGLAHLADGTGPGLQRLWSFGSQLLHFFPNEEELEGEAKPAEDELVHQGSPYPEPAPKATRPLHQAGCDARPCHLRAHGLSGQAVGVRLGVPFSGAGAGDSRGSAHTQGDEVPTLDVAQGLSAFLCLKEEQGSLQGAPGALEVCGIGGGQWHWGEHPTGCSPTFPTLTLFALLGTWKLGGGCGPVQVPAVCHGLRDLIVDALWTQFLCVGATCGEQC